MRLRLIQDESCHWYAIPAEKQTEFEGWVNSFNYDENPAAFYEGPDYSHYRLNCHISNYTMVDLQEDK